MRADKRVDVALESTLASVDRAEEAALRFAQSLKFLPAREGDTPVACEVFLPVRYRLVDR